MFHVSGAAHHDIILGQPEFTRESESAEEDHIIYVPLGALHDWRAEVMAHIFNALHHHVTPIIMHCVDIK